MIFLGCSGWMVPVQLLCSSNIPLEEFSLFLEELAPEVRRIRSPIIIDDFNATSQVLELLTNGEGSLLNRWPP